MFLCIYIYVAHPHTRECTYNGIHILRISHVKEFIYNGIHTQRNAHTKDDEQKSVYKKYVYKTYVYKTYVYKKCTKCGAATLPVLQVAHPCIYV